MNQLKGRKALITGGGRGIGKAVAIHLAKLGVSVGITGRNEARLKETVNALKEWGVYADYRVFDMVDEAAVKKGVEELAASLGGLDILINNAGIGAFGRIDEMPSEQWEEVIRVNLFGVYYAAKAAYPFLQKSDAADVINVASTAGLKAGGSMSAYAASKAAVISLSQSMMAEWRKENIRVVTLTPSTIASDMSIQGGLTDGNPEKVLQPEDFAQWVGDILQMNRRALIAQASIFSTNP